MMTRRELEIEAHRLEQQVRDARNEPNSNAVAPIAISGIGPKPLFTFPESLVSINSGPESEDPLIHRVLRHITSVEGRAGPEYRLIEEEFVSDSKGQLVRHYDPIDISTDGDALGILSAGFQRIDEDRLWERIEPVVQRIEENGFTESDEADAVSEVERYTSVLDLSAAARMRVKADTVDLLEGRLEMGDFIARSVARQECYAVVQRAILSRQHTESIEV